MTDTWQVCYVFAAGVAIDLAYVAWMRGVSDRQPVRAALASMAIGACSLLGLTGVVADHWLAVPWLLGLGVGTAVGVVLK